jgi:hypothetical protein
MCQLLRQYILYKQVFRYEEKYIYAHFFILRTLLSRDYVICRHAVR